MLRRSTSFDFALTRAALLGLVARRMLLPHISCQDLHGRISAHCGLVLQSLFHHLGYLLLLDYQLCLIWTVTQGVRSDLEGSFLFWCLQRSWRGIRSGQQNFYIANAQAGVYVPSIIIGFSALVDGSDIYPLIRRRSLQALDHPKVLPDYRGFPKFSEVLICDCERRPRKLGSCLLLFSSIYKEVFNRPLPFLKTGFWVYPYSLDFCEE